MRRHELADKGAAAIMVAASLVFLMGMAALAVDTSGFYQTARVGQTTADLACLAGAAELPDDDDAIDMAHAYAVANWPEMASAFFPANGNPRTATDGNGNTIYYEAGYGGDPDVMYVAINDRDATTFGRVVGSESVDIAQEASCRRDLTGGGGGVPFMAATGGFGGALQIDPPCGPQSGNCGPLTIPRDDVSGQGNTLIKNISDGPDRILATWLGSQAGAVNCSSVSAGDTCHIIRTDTGVSASHLGNGVFDRLNNDPTATNTYSYRGGSLNRDTPADVLGSAPTPLFSAFPNRPGWWNEDLYGPYNAAATSNHYWYSGTVAKCESKLIAGVPIATDDLDWNLGDPHAGFPNGNKQVKVVGWYDVIITEPDASNDWQGNKNLKTFHAVVIWYAPGTTCTNGDPIGVLNGLPPGTPEESVRLVEP